ncbi:putative serine/threonine-protein kinase [Hordeum vulgare]|nr:putative serine/threonine-protein kinase [Hordeum vulgare]
MDGDLDAAAGLASLISSGITTAPPAKGRRHGVDTRDEAAAVAAIAAAELREDTAAGVTTATRGAFLYLGLNPGQHGLVNAAVAATSTCSCAFHRMALLELPRASMTQPIPGFHVYLEASRLFEECSPEVSVVAPSTPAPAPISLSATPVADGSSSGGPRKRAREMSVDMLSSARNLFNEMPTAVDGERANRFMQSIIFEGDATAIGSATAVAVGYNPEETQC